MKNLSTWLLVIFMFMFWVFRVIVAFQAQYGNDFGGFIPFNFNTEVILLFVVILCFILVLRRNLIGGILYLASYGYYFGLYILNNISDVLGGEANFTIIQNVFVSAVALFLAICVFADLMISKVRKKDPKDKKTDWYFKDDKYDRKYDERADKNQYRNY